MSALAGQTTSGTSSISQKAAVEALTGPQEAVCGDGSTVLSTRKSMFAGLYLWLRGYLYADPEGAFYLFVDIRPLLGRPSIAPPQLGGETLLEQAGVAVVPGEAFCAPGYFRLSFATPLPFLQDGVEPGSNNSLKGRSYDTDSVSTHSGRYVFPAPGQRSEAILAFPSLRRHAPRNC